MMVELVDLDEERLGALNVLIRKKEKIAKAYNKKVKSKIFTVGDYVWKVILPIDRKDGALAKWSPNWKGSFRINQVFSSNSYEIEELGLDSQILRVNDIYLKRYKPMLQEIKISWE